MDINDVRKQIAERWMLITNFGGEWNQGYFEGVNFAIGVIDEFIRANKPKDNKQTEADYKHEKQPDFLTQSWLNKSWVKVHPSVTQTKPPVEDTKKCGKNCACKNN